MVHLVLCNLTILANKELSNREDSGTFFPKYNKLSKIVNLIDLIIKIIFLTEYGLKGCSENLILR